MGDPIYKILGVLKGWQVSPWLNVIETHLSYHEKRATLDDNCPSDWLEGETPIMLRWKGL